MKIKYISYRVEFQARGAAHIHGIIWLDMKKIESLPLFHDAKSEPGKGNLSKAFRKFRDDEKLTTEEKDAIEKFTDMFTSCSLNPNTIHTDVNIGHRIIDIVKEVNCHNCTKPCEKYGDSCKYGFPRWPLKKTLVVDKKEFSAEAEKDKNIVEDKTINHENILIIVEQLLKDKVVIEEIMNKIEKGTTEEEYDLNR